MRVGPFICLICALLLTLTACGNKGPLVAAEEDQPKKNEPAVVE